MKDTRTRHNQLSLDGLEAFLRHAASPASVNGGWHKEFDGWLHWLSEAVQTGSVTPAQAQTIWQKTLPPAALSPATCQGHVCTKPRGYDGDFEIIERIYARWRSPDPSLAKWDDYFHAQAAPKAVRNRKRYFLDWLTQSEARANGDELRLLNVGSGPARDVFEHFSAKPESRVRIECVDSDPEAIGHAAALCAPFATRLRFHRANAVRFRPQGKFHLIWSGGLFDYLSDNIFARLLKRLWASLAPGGELVVGNFSPANPSRAYMEFLGRWVLIHRSEAELMALALGTGALPEPIHIAAEPEGVNLFLHLRK